MSATDAAAACAHLEKLATDLAFTHSLDEPVFGVVAGCGGACFGWWFVGVGLAVLIG